MTDADKQPAAASVEITGRTGSASFSYTAGDETVNVRVDAETYDLSGDSTDDDTANKYQIKTSTEVVTEGSGNPDLDAGVSYDSTLTNKGIQIEVETLLPVGVGWNSK